MRHREIARGALWNTLGYILGGISALATPILLLEWLGRAQYGVVMYAASLASQSYLLNLGMGEVMAQRLTASASIGQWTVGWATLRSALSVVWLSTAVLSGLWLLQGPEMITALLALSEVERQLLEEVYLWVPPALWGIQTGMFLNWVPIALGRFRWAAVNTLLQALWQSAFPLILLLLSSERSPLLVLRVILGGYAIYGASLWLLTAQRLGRVPWVGSLRPALALLRAGLWPALSSLLAIPLTFTERTLISRWASLNLMGFYSALQYLLSKFSALALKAVESLFPVFGSQSDSPHRQALRLSQSVWLTTLLSTSGGLGGWAFTLWVYSWLPVKIGPIELQTLAGFWGSFLAFLPIMPVTTFFTSRGLLRTAFGVNLCIAGVQLGLTWFFARAELYLWASPVALLVGMVLSRYIVGRTKSGRCFWDGWVWPTYLRGIITWGIGAVLWLFGVPSALLGMGLLGLLGVFWATELLGRSTARKRIFLMQLLRSVQGLADTLRRRLLRPARQRALNNR